MNAERTAKEILEACVGGTAEIVIGVPAKLAAVVDAIAPNVTDVVFAAVNQWLLPSPAADTANKKRR